MDPLGRPTGFGLAGTSQHGLDDLFAQDELGGQRADRGPRGLLAAGRADALDQALPAKLAQVVDGDEAAGLSLDVVA